jgi:hypothetical protein
MLTVAMLSELEKECELGALFDIPSAMGSPTLSIYKLGSGIL